ncbi:MAG TPA: hypothetical protein VFZ34_30415 [Blastocatellia bacterium]|nr:hypothetical protein [Blastocatellia bacterium]
MPRAASFRIGLSHRKFDSSLQHGLPENKAVKLTDALYLVKPALPKATPKKSQKSFVAQRLKFAGKSMTIGALSQAQRQHLKKESYNDES